MQSAKQQLKVKDGYYGTPNHAPIAGMQMTAGKSVLRSELLFILTVYQSKKRKVVTR